MTFNHIIINFIAVMHSNFPLAGMPAYYEMLHDIVKFGKGR